MLDVSDMSHQWKVYAGGAREIGKVIYKLDQVYQGDAAVILNWMFYHDALFNFSVRHWRQKTSGLHGCVDNQFRKAVLQSGHTSKVGLHSKNHAEDALD
jgi:hypothetical protein